VYICADLACLIFSHPSSLTTATARVRGDFIIFLRRGPTASSLAPTNLATLRNPFLNILIPPNAFTTSSELRTACSSLSLVLSSTAELTDRRRLKGSTAIGEVGT